MVRRHNRLLVAFYVISDAILGISAFVLAYVLRFESGLIPVTKGFPPFSQYVNVLPFIGVLGPFAYQVRGCTDCDAGDRASTTSSPSS